MASQSVGNLCNYAIFVWLVSSDLHPLSNHAVALTIGAVSGWFVNYVGARFAVFHRHVERV
jgi:putative flippase GtrA